MTIPRASIDSNRARDLAADQNIRSAGANCPVLSACECGCRCHLVHVGGSPGNGAPQLFGGPDGTNFIVMDYARSSGDISFDPFAASYGSAGQNQHVFAWLSHSFGVLGHVASVAIAVPYANAKPDGQRRGRARARVPIGIGDTRFQTRCQSPGWTRTHAGRVAQRSPATIVGCQCEASLRRQASTFHPA